MNDEKCCGTCKDHRYDRNNEEWICMNRESDAYGEYTQYSDKCGEWEEK